jgi:methylenetetrahydrofolate dehydrogenase (NADP+)/methenyltetrahydrofolate cyclohydrolase
MIVDGRALAETLKAEIRARGGIEGLTLAVIVTGADAVTKSYVGIKKRVASDLGIRVIDCNSVEEALVADGIILQLPLLSGMDVEVEKNKIPVEKDVDVLSDAAFALFAKGGHPAVPPVPAGMAYVLQKNNVAIAGKKVAIVGHGRLVGKPAAVLFKQLGATVVVADKGDDVGAITRDADIVILGTGIAGILKPDMIRSGVAILDAGASELGGKVVGDADPACAEKAALFTPVPGGIGPVAVTEIFVNLVALAQGRRSA